MASFIISCLLSAGLIWAFRACARNPYWGMAGACFLAAGVAIISTLFVCLVFQAVALQSALTFVLLLGCIVFRCKPNVVVPVSIAAMVASYGFFLVRAFSDLHELSKVRQRYPLQSVSDRLVYEVHGLERGAPVANAAQHPVLSFEVERRLAMREEQRTRSDLPWRHNRRTMLASLHNRKSNEFAMAQGFGYARMMAGFVSEKAIELPPVEPISIPAETEPTYDPDYQIPNAGVDEGEQRPRQPSKENLLAFHESGAADFVNPDRIGYVQDRDHVAGFQSHRFTTIPEVGTLYSQPQSPWKVARLELVSLLKHEMPVAYVSKHLPQMDELRDAPTRPLEDFERRSLDRLALDEDVVLDETPDRIRMVGSLRAANECLKCHSVQRGELLGALTYELVPARPTRKTRPPVSPPSS